MTLNPVNPINKDSDRYRSYILRSHCDDNSMWIGEVFKSDTRIAYCEAKDEASSKQHLRAIVDTTIKIKSDERTNLPPSADEISQAIPLAILPGQRALIDYLIQHAQNGDQSVPINKLVSLSTCHSTTSLYCLLAEISRAIYDEIGYEPKLAMGERDPFLKMMLDNKNDSCCDEEEITLNLSDTFLNALCKTKW